MKKYIIFILMIITLFMLVTGFTAGCRNKINNTIKPTTTTTTSTINTSIATEFRIDSSAVIKADLIVLGTITNRTYEVTTVNVQGVAGKRVSTLSTFSIEKTIKGDPGIKEVIIKNEGGVIDTTSIVGSTGPEIGDKYLFGLQKEGEVFTTLYNGVFWTWTTIVRSTAKLDDIIGYLIEIMLANGITISLPQSDWPPLPIKTTRAQ